MNTLQMKSKILVTGGTGYIGSHTVVELIEAGYEPVIVDDFSNSDEEVLKQIETVSGQQVKFHKLNLCDEKLVKELAATYPDLEGVIHFAAFKAVGESMSFPLKYYYNNIHSLINLLQAFEGRPVNFVFSSSCTVYGQPDVLPVTEKAPFKKAESPYGNTKQVAEEILSDLAASETSFRIVSLRYFNPVGAHASALLGELPNGVPQNLVPFITQSAIGKRGPITVFGNDYNTADGSCIRDFIHVVDLAKAHIAALKHLEGGAAKTYEAFNIGTGKGSSVLQIIAAFEQSTGVRLNYRIGDRRPGDIEQIYGDVSYAEEVLGWKANLGLPEMLASAWKWEQKLVERTASTAE